MAGLVSSVSQDANGSNNHSQTVACVLSALLDRDSVCRNCQSKWHLFKLCCQRALKCSFASNNNRHDNIKQAKEHLLKSISLETNTSLPIHKSPLPPAPTLPTDWLQL